MSLLPEGRIGPMLGGSDDREDGEAAVHSSMTEVPQARTVSRAPIADPLLTRLPRLLLWVVAAGSGLIFLAMGSKRLFYPLELDCIEGVMMDHVVRLAQGQSIFVAPSLSFIPLAYMPFFAFVSSLLARVFGPQFWEPRVISMLAVLGTVALIVRIVRAETRSWTMAVAGGAIYLMGFGFTGSCYDVARPDSLMMFLTLAGLAALRFSTGVPGALGAAALLTLAFFTKQHAAWFALAGMAHLLVNDRRRVLPFALAILAGCAGGFALLSLWLGPWFKFFTLEIPSHWSELSKFRILRYLGHGLIGTLGLLAGPAVLSLGLARPPWRGREGLWVWAALAAVGTGLMATLDPSAYLHLFIPTLVVFCVIGPISLHRLVAGVVDRGVASPQAAGAAACAVLALQFVPLFYSVHDQLPHKRAIEAYQMLMSDIQHQPGPVLTPYHGFYTWSAGKGTSLHVIPLDDIVRANGNRLLAQDPHFLERMFEPLRSGAGRPVIITDVPLSKSGPLWAAIENDYVLAGDLGWISDPLRPVSGNPFAPTFVYVPRGRANQAHAANGTASPQPRGREPVAAVAVAAGASGPSSR